MDSFGQCRREIMLLWWAWNSSKTNELNILSYHLASPRFEISTHLLAYTSVKTFGQVEIVNYSVLAWFGMWDFQFQENETASDCFWQNNYNPNINNPELFHILKDSKSWHISQGEGWEIGNGAWGGVWRVKMYPGKYNLNGNHPYGKWSRIAVSAPPGNPMLLPFHSLLVGSYKLLSYFLSVLHSKSNGLFN